MSYRFSIVVFLFLLTVGSAFAGPPLLTDDPDTPGDKHWEINVAFVLNKYQTESTYDTPNLDLNYGVGNNIQIKYEVPWLILHEQGIGTQTGLGNSNFGVKWRFLNEEQYGVNMSTYPQYEFHSITSSVNKGLVEEGTNLLLPVEVSKKMGPVLIDGEVGYTIEQQHEDEWLYGFFIGYDVRENLTILGEIHCITAKGINKNDAVFNVGTQWDFTKNYGLLASAGRSLANGASDEPNLLLYLGLQIRL